MRDQKKNTKKIEKLLFDLNWHIDSFKAWQAFHSIDIN